MLRMPFTAPDDWDATIGFLAERAVPGVESVESGVYRRTVTLDGAPGMLEIGPGGTDHLQLRAHLPYWEGIIHVVERAARLAGIDSDPHLASARLATDAALGSLIISRPGVRVPGAWGPFDAASTRSSARSSTPRRLKQPRSSGPLPRDARRWARARAHARLPIRQSLPNVPANGYGLPDRLGEAVSALARAVASGAVTLDGGEPLEELWDRWSPYPESASPPRTTSPCASARETRSRRWTRAGAA